MSSAPKLSLAKAQFSNSSDDAEFGDSIFSNISIGVMTIAANGEARILSINSAASQMFGIKEEACLEKSLWTAIPVLAHLQTHYSGSLESMKFEKGLHIPIQNLASRTKLEHKSEPKLEHPAEFDGQINNGGSSGATLYFFLRSFLSSKDKVILFFEDFTRQRALEAELEYQKLIAINEGRLSTVGRMGAGIAHEINNPLAIIVGNISLIRKHLAKLNQDTSVFETSLDRMKRSADRISRIVMNLRSFSRDTSNDPLENESIEQILRKALDLYETRMRNHGVGLTIEGDALQALVECHPYQIAQVFANLLSNSTEAIDRLEAKWIRIMVSDFKDKVEIRVEDSGPGILPEIGEKIMTPFFTTKELGTGIGLTIARSILANHNGTIHLDKKSANTCFVVILPKTQAVVKFG